jgi:hypothetical protein
MRAAGTMGFSWRLARVRGPPSRREPGRGCWRDGAGVEAGVAWVLDLAVFTRWKGMGAMRLARERARALFNLGVARAVRGAGVLPSLATRVWGGGGGSEAAEDNGRAARDAVVGPAAGAAKGEGAVAFEVQGWASTRSRGIQSAADPPQSQNRAQAPEGRLVEEGGATVSCCCCCCCCRCPPGSGGLSGW